MAQRLQQVKEMTFEINGTAAYDFEDRHFVGRMTTVVVKKKMTESQAMENQLKREIATAEATTHVKNENPEESKHCSGGSNPSKRMRIAIDTRNDFAPQDMSEVLAKTHPRAIGDSSSLSSSSSSETLGKEKPRKIPKINSRAAAAIQE